MDSGRAGLSLCLAAQASTTFTQFGRKTDGRYGIMPGGATAFLCMRGHMLPFLFTFIICRPSGDLNPREGRRRRSRHFQERMPYGLFVPDVPDATAYPRRQWVTLILVNGPRLGLRRARQELHNRAQCTAWHFWIEVRLFDPRDYEFLLRAHASA
jgi:hypothetical protein